MNNLEWSRFTGGKTKDLMTFGAYDGIASYVVVLKPDGNQSGFVASYCLLKHHKDRAKVQTLPDVFKTLSDAKTALEEISNDLRRGQEMRQGCFNCAHMHVEPDAIGRTYVRSNQPYACTWQPPTIAFPVSITDHPTAKMNWPPLRRMVKAGDGAHCPAWRQHKDR